MKKTQIIDFFRTIKSTLVSFCSVTMFVTLGVCTFLGMGWAGNGLALSIQHEQDINNFRDVEIISPYGISDEDLEKLKTVEGVKAVEGTYNYYSYFKWGDTKYQAKVCTLPKDINTFFSFEGTMPSKANEIVVERYWAEKYGIKPGDTITFLHDANEHPHAVSLLLENEDKIDDPEALIKVFEEDKPDEDGMQAFRYDTFTVTGLGESPDYISTLPETYGTSTNLGTPVEIIMFAPKEAFDEKSFTGYGNVYVKSDYLKGVYTDPSFRKENDEFKERLNVVVKEVTAAKNKKILDISTSLTKKLDDAPRQLEEYQEQIDSGKREIELSEKMVDEGEKQLSAGREMLTAGRDMVQRARTEFNERVKQFEQYKDNLKEKVPRAREVASLLESLSSSGDATEVLKKFRDEEVFSKARDYLVVLSALYAAMGDEYMAQHLLDMINDFSKLQSDIISTGAAKEAEALIKRLPEYAQKIKSAIAMKDDIIDLIDNYVKELEDQLNEALGEMDKSQNQLNNSQAQVDSGRSQITEGKKQIEEYQEKLNRMKDLLSGPLARQLSVASSSLKDYSSALLTQYNNPTSALSVTMVELLGRVKYSLASLFFIVGILVCYSALSRIIYSHVKLLGTKKALGLMRREITLSYLLYGAASSIVGCILGLLLGLYVIQPLILLIIKKNFVFRDFVLHFSLSETLIICAIEVVIILFSTYIACRAVLRENPVVLLSGPKPPANKRHFFEKWRLWKRMSLFSKTMINNVIQDKRRVLGTLVGITGCTAMLVCGAIIKLNTDKSPVIEFNDLNKFDTLILFDANKEGCKESIKKVLDDNNIGNSSFSSVCIRTVLPDDRVNLCYLYVTDDENFTDYFLLKNNKGRLKGLADGVRICNGYEETFGISPGEKVEFIDNTGQHFFIPYIGEFEGYLVRTIMVMPADTYERYSMDKYKPNSFTLSLKGVDKEKLLKELGEIPGFITLNDYVEANMNAFKTMSSATLAVAGIAVALAAIMAFLVLLNLFAMHVEEKKREMIILMINGYSIKQAKKYIYMDTILLTAIGIIIGCIFGNFMGNLNIEVFSYMPAHFYRGVCWPAMGFGAVVAALLALINSRLAMRRIKYFNLTDINK